jgi:hypothetical protein
MSRNTMPNPTFQMEFDATHSNNDQDADNIPISALLQPVATPNQGLMFTPLMQPVQIAPFLPEPALLAAEPQSSNLVASHSPPTPQMPHLTPALQPPAQPVADSNIPALLSKATLQFLLATMQKQDAEIRNLQHQNQIMAQLVTREVRTEAEITHTNHGQRQDGDAEPNTSASAAGIDMAVFQLQQQHAHSSRASQLERQISRPPHIDQPSHLGARSPHHSSPSSMRERSLSRERVGPSAPDGHLMQANFVIPSSFQQMNSMVHANMDSHHAKKQPGSRSSSAASATPTHVHVPPSQLAPSLFHSPHAIHASHSTPSYRMVSCEFPPPMPADAHTPRMMIDHSHGAHPHHLHPSSHHLQLHPSPEQELMQLQLQQMKLAAHSRGSSSAAHPPGTPHAASSPSPLSPHNIPMAQLAAFESMSPSSGMQKRRLSRSLSHDHFTNPAQLLMEFSAPHMSQAAAAAQQQAAATLAAGMGTSNQGLHRPNSAAEYHYSGAATPYSSSNASSGAATPNHLLYHHQVANSHSHHHLPHSGLRTLGMGLHSHSLPHGLCRAGAIVGGLLTAVPDGAHALGERRDSASSSASSSASGMSVNVSLPRPASAFSYRPTVGPYSPDERARRLARWKEKRAHRVWNKRVIYQVRKDFAVTRKRVGGRFVKKDINNTAATTKATPQRLNLTNANLHAMASALAAAAASSAMQTYPSPGAASGNSDPANGTTATKGQSFFSASAPPAAGPTAARNFEPSGRSMEQQ